ncbi:MAG TPA: tail fiber protein, partial [Acidobacteriota bacterium]|nr:tail fiber protein [Acidobacteriota bacterium]
EIRMFAGNFAPRGWAFCDGQLLAVSQNDALFSLLGTIYGGDGRTTFGLPDLRGRIPLHAGEGPGLSPRRLGSKGGAEKVTLTVNQLPSHRHDLKASADPATGPNPQGEVLAETVTDRVYSDQGSDVNMASSSITGVGGSRSHTNLMPYLCINFIIALVGIYPSRH